MSVLITSPLWSNIAALASNKLLGDASLPSNPVSLALPSQIQSVTLSGGLGSFSISADARVGFAVVNSASDANVDGYFNLDAAGAPTADDPAKALLVEAPVTFDPAKAYVVLTSLAATGKVTGALTVGSNGALGLSGDQTLEVGSCTAFSRATTAWDALAQATRNFKTVFSSSELRALTPDETLSFGMQGGICLCLNLTFTSLAGGITSAAAAVLGTVGPLSLSWGPSATLAVTVTASDGYRVYAQRAASPGTVFSVSKQISTSLGLDGGLGLTITISDAALETLVNSVFAQLGGVLESDLEAALAGRQAATLSAIVAKLGISDPAHSALESLQNKIADFEAKVVAVITPTVSAQFTYAWKRLTCDSIAVQFTVPDAVLDKYLPDILCLNLAGVTNSDPADGITVSRLLGRNSQEIDIGYGFSFGVDDYVFLKSSDSVQKRFVELDTNVAQRGLLRQFSFLGKRGYTANWFGMSWNNFVELDCDMPAPLAAPTANDFQVGLSVAFSWTGFSFNSILQNVADHGTVVNALDSDDVTAGMRQLTQAGVPGGATGSATVSLVVPDSVLRQILPVLTGPHYRDEIVPNAIGRALPCTPENQMYPERAQANRRGQVYAQMWSSFLATEDPDDGTIPGLCNRTLRDAGCTNALAFSEGATPNNLVWSAATIAAEASLGDFQDAILNRLPAAFLGLQNRSGDFRQLFAGCSDGLGELAAQPFGCRVLAGILMLAANETPGCLEQVVRTVKFDWKESAGACRTVVAKNGS